MTQTLTFALVDTLQEDLPARPGWRHAARYGLAIGNVPVICHVVGELADGGIEQVRVLTRDSEQAQLQATLGDGGKWGVQISYAEPQGPEHDRALLIELEQALTEQAVL